MFDKVWIKTHFRRSTKKAGCLKWTSVSAVGSCRRFLDEPVPMTTVKRPKLYPVASHLEYMSSCAMNVSVNNFSCFLVFCLRLHPAKGRIWYRSGGNPVLVYEKKLSLTSS